MDGQRIANTTSGDSGLQYLNIDQIERVEVLRGSRSVIYGSDAIGGVIQCLPGATPARPATARETGFWQQ